MKGFQQLVWATSISMAIMSSPAQAAYGEPFNYYEPAPDKILENVEKYHLGQGIEKARTGKYEYAWSEFAFMLHYFPNHPVALTQIGNLSIQMENPKRAEKYFDNAIRLFPHEANTYALQGVFLHNQGHFDKAIESYEKALKLNDTPLEFHYNLGLALFATEDYQASLEHAQKAYQHGYPLPGLKEKLKSVSVWKEPGRPKA